MERMSRQEQSLLEFRRPSRLNESQIKLFVRSVNFVANNWMADRSKMDPDLVSSASIRNSANQTKLAVAGASRFNKASFDTKFGLCGRSSRVNHLFQPDLGSLMFALSIQRSVDDFGFPFRPAPN